MFARRNSSRSASARLGRQDPNGLSFIGPEVTIGGDVATTAQLHVDGRIEGHVRCASLCQGSGGVVVGDIVADEARLAGLVQGTVSAATLVVEATGRITGDVTYETISIAAGGRIDGRLARREALAPGENAPELLIATPTETEDNPASAAGEEAPGLFPIPAGKRKAAA